MIALGLLNVSVALRRAHRVNSEGRKDTREAFGSDTVVGELLSPAGSVDLIVEGLAEETFDAR